MESNVKLDEIVEKVSDLRKSSIAYGDFKSISNIFFGSEKKRNYDLFIKKIKQFYAFLDYDLSNCKKRDANNFSLEVNSSELKAYSVYLTNFEEILVDHKFREDFDKMAIKSLKDIDYLNQNKSFFSSGFSEDITNFREDLLYFTQNSEEIYKVLSKEKRVSFY